MYPYIKNNIKHSFKYKILLISLTMVILSKYGLNTNIINLAIILLISMEFIKFIYNYSGKGNLLFNMIPIKKYKYLISSILIIALDLLFFLISIYIFTTIYLEQDLKYYSLITYYLYFLELSLVLFSFFIINDYSFSSSGVFITSVLSLFFTRIYYLVVAGFNRIYNKTLVMPIGRIVSRRELKNTFGIGKDLTFLYRAYNGNHYINYVSLFLRISLLMIIVLFAFYIVFRNLRRED